MITLYDGIKLAIIFLVVGAYIGFFARLLFYEKITHPAAVMVSTYLFTLQMIVIIISPFFTVLLAIYDKDVRKPNTKLPAWKNQIAHIFVVLVSPIVGVRYVFRNLPRLYNELFPALHSIINDLKRGWRIIVSRKRFSDFKDYQTKDMNEIFARLVHQN